MKTSTARYTIIIVSILVMLSLLPLSSPAFAQDEELTPTATLAPLIEHTRPLVIMESYKTNNEIKPGNDFYLDIILRNDGGKANNVIIVFESQDFLPLETGGVRALVSLDTKKPVKVAQPMMAPASLWGQAIGSVTVRVTYMDEFGVTYSETFLLTLNIQLPNWAAVTATPTPTATIMAVERPQIVVAGYKTNIDPLQPGSIFNLELNITNLGTADAKAVTMVLGGGATVDFDNGTPQPGGITGGSSELTTFAPLGSSNLFYVGDMDAGKTFQGLQQLIVNVSATPGAYPLKLSFVYTDEKGNRAVDAQVITLLIYQLPQLEISFYRDPGMLMMHQPNMLPVQVMNLGKKSALLGNMKVTCGDAEISSNSGLVGPLDVGMYFTLDPMVIPSQSGIVECDVLINYNDDFNQPRTVSQVLSLEVMDAPLPEEFNPEMEGMPPIDMGVQPGNETFWQKVVRFFKGLFGLDSAPAQMEPIMEGPYMEEGPVKPEQPVEVRPKG
jgi:hypothetical protein